MIIRPLSVFIFTSVVSLGLSSSVFADGLYKWVDSRGQIQYGDSPPENVRLENLDMPALTVIEDYASQWKSPDDEASKRKSAQWMKPQPTQKFISKPVIVYDKLKLIAPKLNQVIHAKDGDVSAMLSISPPLKRGHKIIFKLDADLQSKKSLTSKSRIANFTNLNLGFHNLTVEIRDSQERLVQKSETVKFRLFRFDSARSAKK